MGIKGKSNDVKHSSIELNIEKLVLQGFHQVDDYKLSKSIEQEFAKLFKRNEQSNQFENNIYLNNVNAGNILVTSNSGSAEIGKQVASVIYNSITKKIL